MIKGMSIGLHVKYLYSCHIFMKIYPVGAELFHSDGVRRTDRHDEAFCNIAKMPKN